MDGDRASLASLISDEAREQRIKRFGELMVAATLASDCVLFWELMRAEIEDRSPAQIARMEAEKGLG